MNTKHTSSTTPSITNSTNTLHNHDSLSTSASQKVQDISASSTASTSAAEKSSDSDKPKKKKTMAKRKKFGLKLTLDHSDAIATPRPVLTSSTAEGKTSVDSNTVNESKTSPKTRFSKAKKKKNRLGLTLVVEDSNHEPESPKASSPQGGFGLSIDTGDGPSGGIQTSDSGGYSGSSSGYGMSDSGTFAIDGFLIRQNGIQEAPGARHESPGFGRRRPGASKTNGSNNEGKFGGDESTSTISSDGSNAEDELLRLCVLGKGAGGIVYKAVHVPSLRIVAIKKIAVFDQDKRHQMVRELKALYKNLVPIAGAGSSTARGSIREGPCPYIVAFHDAFITPSEGNISIVLEYMDGGSLQDIVDTGGCGLESVLANISYRFLLGIDFIHEHHQLHRDIKPSNLLINHHGAVKISDFGIVREMDGTQAKASTFVGTLTYMSPERISGEEYSYASDVWSFGLSLLTVALGRYPLQTEGGYWGLLHSLRDEPSPELPKDGDFSDVFHDFINQCLKKDPKDRPTANNLLKHPFLEGCAEQLEQQERDRKIQRQRDLSMMEDDGSSNDMEDGEDVGSDTARSELDEICELVMDLEFKRWQLKNNGGGGSEGGRPGSKPFPRVPRSKLAALSDQLGLRLKNVERRFERKWLSLIMGNGDGSARGLARRK
jgi:serine/threonine protein kinase